MSNTRVLARIAVALGTLALSLTAQAMSTSLMTPKPSSMHPLVIYGTDNRLEVHEEPDASRRALADSVVAIMSARSIRTGLPGIANITGSKFGDSNNLCTTEKFYDQVAPAYCSGFLVADNIIATAGHCVQDIDFCQDARFVFGFAMDASARDPNALKSDDVYGCKQVLHEEVNGNGSDFALVELDRKVVGRTPVRFATKAPAPGESVFVIGHPSGLPAKIAGGATVRRNATGFFVANLDTYGGNSGSAVFNETTNEVAGILVRGETDFVRRGTCNVSYQCQDALCRGEDVTNPDIVADKLLDIVTTPDPITPVIPQVPAPARSFTRRGR